MDLQEQLKQRRAEREAAAAATDSSAVPQIKNEASPIEARIKEKRAERRQKQAEEITTAVKGRLQSDLALFQKAYAWANDYGLVKRIAHIVAGAILCALFLVGAGGALVEAALIKYPRQVDEALVLAYLLVVGVVGLRALASNSLERAQKMVATQCIVFSLVGCVVAMIASGIEVHRLNGGGEFGPALIYGVPSFLLALVVLVNQTKVWRAAAQQIVAPDI